MFPAFSAKKKIAFRHHRTSLRRCDAARRGGAGMLGTTIGVRGIPYIRRNSPLFKVIEVGLGTDEDAQAEDVQQQPNPAPEADPESNIKGKFNIPCRYFWWSPKGCLREDCRFLHEEYEPPPLTRVDAKLYLTNIPPKMDREHLMDIIDPIGKIGRIVVLPSKVASGRKAAIVHMTDYEEKADVAVNAINAYVDYTGEHLSAVKQLVVPLETPPAPAAPAAAPAPAAPPPSVIASPVTVMTCIPCYNEWNILADLDEDESDDDDDVMVVVGADNKNDNNKNFTLSKCNMPPLNNGKMKQKSISGCWKDTVRTHNMIAQL